MKVSVVILNWNGIEMLSRFLPDVVANTDTSEAQIVVADNGSTDGSVEFVARHFPQLRLIRLDNNYGFAEGYNRAIALIDTPLCVLLNSDVKPAPGWFSPLVEFMDTHPDYAACQPKILSVDAPHRFEFAGAAGGFIDKNGYPYCRGRIFSTVEPDNGQYDTPIDIDWATGACMMIRTDLYRRTGGLDAAFFAHMEEIDLCWRLRNSGYRIAAVPQSIVYHLGGGTLPAENPRKTYLNFRNNLLMLYKNLPANTRGRKLFWRRILDSFAWGMYVVTGKWKFASAIIKAHCDYRRMKKQYIDMSAPQHNLLSGRPNILTSYYLKRKRTFSTLKK